MSTHKKAPAQSQSFYYLGRKSCVATRCARPGWNISRGRTSAFPPLSPQRLLTDLSVTPLRVLRVSHPRGRTPSPKQNSPKRFHAEAVCWAKAHFLAESRPKIQVVLLQSNSTTDSSPTPAETSAHTNSLPTSSPPQNQTAQSEPHTSRVRAPATDTHPIATTTPQPQAASYTKPHSASRGHHPYLPTIPKSKT